MIVKNVEKVTQCYCHKLRIKMALKFTKSKFTGLCSARKRWAGDTKPHKNIDINYLEFDINQNTYKNERVTHLIDIININGVVSSNMIQYTIKIQMM